MARFKDQAICVRQLDWSESSQIVALLTERHGLVRAVARGAKRSSPSAVARYSGGIELLTGGQAVGIIKRSADLANLTEWDLQQPNWHLHEDLAAQRLGCYAADLARAFVPDLEPHPAAFAALRDLLADLARPDARPAALLRYQWRLLDDCGYRPSLDADAPPYEFDAHGGGLVTRKQDATRNGRWAVRPETVHALRAVAAGDELEPAEVMGANRLLCAYARAILDRELATMRYVMDGGV